MRIEPSIRCLDCGCPVHRALGGAWCEAHRPVDLTGGVAPWDRPTPRDTRGYAPTVRAVYGEVPAMLAAAGWERVDRGGKAWWRDPRTGLVHTQETARRKAFTAKPATPRRRGRTPLSPDDPTTLRWIELLESGVAAPTIARDFGVGIATVYERVRNSLRARGAA